MSGLLSKHSPSLVLFFFFFYQAVSQKAAALMGGRLGDHALYIQYLISSLWIPSEIGAFTNEENEDQEMKDFSACSDRTRIQN